MIHLRRLGGLFVGMILVFLVADHGVTASKPGTPMGLLVPAYFDPEGDPLDWSRLVAAAKVVPLTVILNPNSGPGRKQDPLLKSFDNAIRKNGGRVIGYISTSYGNRPLSQVFADINVYLAFYPLDGFFIDEMTNDSLVSDLNYYASIYHYIKARSPNFTVIGNPGAPTVEGYFTHITADVIIEYEDLEATFLCFDPPGWNLKYPASRFGQIVYGAAPADLHEILADMQLLHAGMVYVTDDAGRDGNAYERLPVFWQAELSAVEALTTH